MLRKKSRVSTNISSGSGKKMEPRCFVGATGDDLPPIPSVMDLAQEHEIVSENTSWETHCEQLCKTRIQAWIEVASVSGVVFFFFWFAFVFFKTII